jgi:hypothetical protein
MGKEDAKRTDGKMKGGTEVTVSHWWEDKDRLLLNSSRRHVFDDKVG